MAAAPRSPLTRQGPFLEKNGKRHRWRGVTYGPFPPRDDGAWFRSPLEIQQDFKYIRSLGFNGVRIYSPPTPDLLAAAEASQLDLACGLLWPTHSPFTEDLDAWKADRLHDLSSLQPSLSHPNVAFIFVANEIPSDLVRFLGPAKVQAALDWLITQCQLIFPNKLVAYANYPSTEYLEIPRADLSVMNVYLESLSDFKNYLRRLQILCSDRPLLLGEIGLDSSRHGKNHQAELITQQIQFAEAAGIAGWTLYAYSDLWWQESGLVNDWDFGMLDRHFQPKPLAHQLHHLLSQPAPRLPDGPNISVIICSKNGAQRLPACLQALSLQSYPAHEICLVDDASAPPLSKELTSIAPRTQLFKLPPSGLSSARNAGAARCSGDVLVYLDDDCQAHPDWLKELAIAFSQSTHAAIGGPNLPPHPESLVDALIAAAPGRATHVMLNDLHAEHLPGCNLAVRREAFDFIGGFDPQFHTAGDDVDFCWRLLDAGFTLGFAPNALVWHHPRTSIRSYLKQQWGYGKAESLLRVKHPLRFNAQAQTIWHGVVYGTSALTLQYDSLIHHGQAGLAPFQGLIRPTLGQLPIARDHAFPFTHFCLQLLSSAQLFFRTWARSGIPQLPISSFTMRLNSSQESSTPSQLIRFSLTSPLTRNDFLNSLASQGWHWSSDPSWDLQQEERRLICALLQHSNGTRELLIRLSPGGAL